MGVQFDTVLGVKKSKRIPGKMRMPNLAVALLALTVPIIIVGHTWIHSLVGSERSAWFTTATTVTTV